jgi:hypothetical protein
VNWENTGKGERMKEKKRRGKEEKGRNKIKRRRYS